MMNNTWKDFLKDKRVTLMGLGLLGRGIGDALFLSKYAKEVIVTDLKSAQDLHESLKLLEGCKNIIYRLGEHSLEDFENVDLVVRGANVPLNSPHIEHARKHNIPVYLDESLFIELAPQIVLVGVTGTRGKTTVTTMIYEVLSKSETSHKVFLSGNIQGKATLPLLEEVVEGDFVVMELSSWQLQGFHGLMRSPHVSVFTNFFPDHLNYYNNSMQLYYDDKAAIFAYQTNEDYIVMSSQASEMYQEYGKAFSMKGALLSGSEYAVPEDWNLQLPGAHNRENAALARAALVSLGIPDEKIKDELESFKGVEGRLETIYNKSGIRIINDTTSTTPDALLVALRSVKDANLVLMMGGADKGLDFNNVISEIRGASKVILLAGTGTEKIKPLLSSSSISFTETHSITEALAEAQKSLQDKGGTLLFSPGFSSFGMFVNEYDRGDQFVKAVKSLFN